MSDSRLRDGETDLDHCVLEPFPVLRRRDRLGVGADELRSPGDTHLAALVQGHREVQPRLAAEGCEHRIGTLPLQDLAEEVGGERFDVRAIGEVRVRHDRRRIRVRKNHAVALTAQHPTGLGSGIVEFAGLTDHDRARPDDEDGLNVVTARHQAAPPCAGARSPAG